MQKSNFVKNSINLIQITFPIPVFCWTQNIMPVKECPSRVFKNHKNGINELCKGIISANPVQIRRIQGDLMNKVSSEALYISNIYSAWIDTNIFSGASWYKC